MNRDEIHQLLDQVVGETGSDEVVLKLKGLLSDRQGATNLLTIVSNSGVHKIPEEFLRGEIYEASRGDWNVATSEELTAEIKSILTRLVIKLQSRRWERIYLIPTGHPILSLQIKAMVYRVLRCNTIDLYYKAGTYFEIDIDQRSIALEAGENA